MSWVKQAQRLAANDLRQELRHMELSFSAMVFVVVIVALFAVGFPVLDKDTQIGAVPAMLWLGLAFTGALTVARSFDRERECSTLTALLTEPVERVALYFAKMVVSWLIMMACGILLVAGLGLLFPIARILMGAPGPTFVALALGTFGYCAVGTLFAGGLAAAGGKNLLFAVILYPLTSPVLLYALVVTRRVIESHPDLWSAALQLLAVDAVLVCLGAFLFESLLVGAARPTSTRPLPAQTRHRVAEFNSSKP